MKRALIFTTASVCLLASSSTQAALNLVQDPGFAGGETGILLASSTPWVNPQNNPPIFSQPNVAISANALAPSGWNAVLTSVTGESSIIYQQVALTPGIGYTINFWLADPGSSGGSVEVDLGGTKAAVIAVAGNSAFTEYNLNATPIAAGILDFIWTSSTPPASLEIDNVSVAVPEPTTMIAGALMLLPFAASTLRLRKKVSA
jgi:hypothetical protein